VGREQGVDGDGDGNGGNGSGKVDQEKEDEEKKESSLEKRERNWGPGANFKFCEDVFLPCDEYMMQSCKGKDYASSSPFSPPLLP